MQPAHFLHLLHFISYIYKQNSYLTKIHSGDSEAASQATSSLSCDHHTLGHNSLHNLIVEISPWNVMQGFVALGAAIMTQLFYVLYPGDPQSFLLMVSWLPALVSLLFMGVIRPIPPAAAVRVQGDHEEDEGSNFNLLLVISFLLGGFLMGVIILQNVVQLGHLTMLVIACLIIFVLVFLPFGVVVRSELASYYKQPTTLQEPLFTDEQRNLNSSSGSQFHSQEQSEFVAADLTEEGYDHLEDSDKTQIQSNNRHNNNSIPSTGQPKQPSPLEAGLTSKFFHPLISISSHKEKKKQLKGHHQDCLENLQIK